MKYIICKTWHSKNNDSLHGDAKSSAVIASDQSNRLSEKWAVWKRELMNNNYSNAKIKVIMQK